MEPVDELRVYLDANLHTLQGNWASAESWQARLAWQLMLHEGGWVAPAWPVEHGGRGLGPAEVFACETLLAERGCPILPGVLGLNNVGPTLIAWGTDEQKRHLPAILSTGEIWCQGFSEPGAGSDLAGLRTTAVRHGDEFVINGQKTWTSNGMQATHMELLVRTDPEAPKHQGVSALVLDMTSPGIDRRPIRQINGDAEFAEVFFDDVRVPVANLLGPVNDGWRVTMTTLGHERSAVAVLGRRLHNTVVETVQRYVGTALPAAHHDELVRRYVETSVLSALGEQMLDRIAAGEQPGAEQSVIKLMWSETGQRVDSTRFALAGTDAVTGVDAGIGRDYLSGRQLTIAGGTTQVVKNIMAERVLGLPRE